MNKIRIAGAAAGVVLVSGIVLQVSSAAFTAETSNDDNAWAAGTVTLTDDDDGLALYATQANIVPGYDEERCIELTYSGSVTPSEPISISAVTDGAAGGVDGDGLQDDLTVAVDLGGLGSTCDLFNPLTATEIFSDSLDQFNAAGAPLDTTWTPDPDNLLGLGTDMVRAFRFTVELPDATTGNDAQGDSATAAFTWSATS